MNKRIDDWRLMADKLRSVIPTKPFGYSQHYAGWCIVRPEGIDIGCPLALAAIPWAVADPDLARNGDILREPADGIQLDVLDGNRYMVASYAHAEDKPAAERRREAIAAAPPQAHFSVTIGLGKNNTLFTLRKFPVGACGDVTLLFARYLHENGFPVFEPMDGPMDGLNLRD